MANVKVITAKQPLSPSARRRGIYYFVAGAVMAAIGLGAACAALIGSDPGLIAEEAVKAQATILAQSVAMVPVQDSPHSTIIRPAYYDTFAFTDGGGQASTGYDDVGGPFYAAHPVGASVDAYYFPGAPDRAVLGTPLGLGPQGIPHELEIGAMLVLIGGLIMAVQGETVLTAFRLARIGRLRKPR